MKNDYPHFRGLWYRVMASLLGAAFIPLVIVGVIFCSYAVSIYKTRSVDMLARDVTLRQRNLDRFLDDRILELKSLARLPVVMLTDQDRFETFARDLIDDHLWINDLTVFDLDGNPLAYAGHYARQEGNYAKREWFRKARDTGSSIGDMEPGFRNLPHVSIAVRFRGTAQDLIFRASLDARQLSRAVHLDQEAFLGADVFLINAEGRYQIPPQSKGKIMALSELGVQEPFDGIRNFIRDNRIRVTTWLSTAPWVVAVDYDRDTVYAPAFKMRTMALWSLVIGGFLIVCLILLTADSLVTRLETKRQRIEHLNRQLRRGSFMASAMELGIGLLRELGDRLSNIAVAAQWMETDLAKGKPLKDTEDIRQINESATEGRERLTQFLALFDKQTAMIVPVNVENMARTLVIWLKKELTLRCIQMVWHVDKDLPQIRTDALKLRHAIQNVLLNAVHAVNQHGEIQIELKGEAGGVAMMVTDNGPGIAEADQKKIFDPLFTTTTDGSGLGLPVARDIVEALGGSLILLRTSPEGSSFRFFLPLNLETAPLAAKNRDMADVT